MLKLYILYCGRTVNDLRESNFLIVMNYGCNINIISVGSSETLKIKFHLLWNFCLTGACFISVCDF